MNSKIWLSSPHMGGEELKFVNEAFETNWVAPLGQNVDGFENDLANYCGVGYAAALSSGTAALHLAMIMLGVGYGDEVICSSFTFSASANPITYLGATPIFVDSEEHTWNMDPNILEDCIKDRIKLGKKPKAIIVVHLYGMPAMMTEILAIASKFEIPIIEDAAEALGSKYFGKAMGSFGIMGILSFNGNKIITTSGGGALITNEEKFAIKARFLSTQSRDAAPHYQHSEIGYNYRMSNICAGIGRGQMIVLDDRVKARRANHEYYKNAFSELQEIIFLDEPEGFFSNRWLTCVLIDEKSKVNREQIRISLEKLNIETRPLWKPMHLQPVFKSAPYYGGNISEKLFERGLCLPSGSNLSQTELNRVSSSIIDLF